MKHYFFILLFLLGCSHHHHHHHENASNQHMHKRSHQELIKTFDDPTRDEWQRPKLILQKMGDIKGKRVIDIGAGSGYFSKFFVQSGARVVAADVDEGFLAHLEKNLPQAKIQKIPFNSPLMKKDSFDFAFMCNTYHHINERIHYLKKIRQGLKPKGKFFMVDFKAVKDNMGPPLRMRLGASEVVKEFLAAGFTEIEINTSLLPKQYFIVGTKE